MNLDTSEIFEGGFIEHRMKNIRYPRKPGTTNEGVSTIIWQCNQNEARQKKRQCGKLIYAELSGLKGAL